MKRKSLCSVLLFALAAATFNHNIFADERSEPVDIFVLVDKSLSMGASGGFSSIISWADEQIVGQMIEEGDWITIYQFYGECENVITAAIEGEADRQRVRDALLGIRADGSFSDIGHALDTIMDALDERAENGRYKVMLLLTDLRHEGAWTSRYPGVIDPFRSPYLDNARVIDHGGWQEITLDMDIHDAASELGRELYREISVQGSSEREPAPLNAEMTVQGQ